MSCFKDCVFLEYSHVFIPMNKSCIMPNIFYDSDVLHKQKKQEEHVHRLIVWSNLDIHSFLPTVFQILEA